MKTKMITHILLLTGLLGLAGCAGVADKARKQAFADAKGILVGSGGTDTGCEALLIYLNSELEQPEE